MLLRTDIDISPYVCLLRNKQWLRLSTRFLVPGKLSRLLAQTELLSSIYLYNRKRLVKDDIPVQKIFRQVPGSQKAEQRLAQPREEFHIQTSASRRGSHIRPVTVLMLSFGGAHLPGISDQCIEPAIIVQRFQVRVLTKFNGFAR